MAISEQLQPVNADSLRYDLKQTVVGQPDIPGLSARDMQMAVENLPRNVLIPIVNSIVNAINSSYSKAEADAAIENKVAAVGAGDMAKAIYDNSGDIERAGGIKEYAENYTTAYIASIQKQLALAAYPVGSYYWSSDPTSPATLFGGTWEQVRDKFVFAAGSKAVGETGGSERVALTTAQLPHHTHTQRAMEDPITQWPFTPTQDWYPFVKSGSWAQKRLTDSTILTNGTTGGAGNGESHENMPPYIVAYCWRRTA